VTINRLLKSTGKIKDIHIQTIRLSEPFIDFAGGFANMPGTVILMSGTDIDCSRYHILGASPWLCFTGKGQNINITLDEESFDFKEEPFNALRNILNFFSADAYHWKNPDLPVSAGIFGYLSYDLKNCLEELPQTCMDNPNLPDICFFAPSIIVIRDKKTNRTKLCIPERTGPNQIDNIYESFKKTVDGPRSQDSDFSGAGKGFNSNFTKPEYINRIKTIKEYIKDGHVYQVNMSQAFETDFQGSPFSLFKTLYKLNPAPFFAFIHAKNHHIVSTSPERFIQRRGDRIETRPIKGTRPRGNSQREDKKLRAELEQSKKDSAELSMIVDLLRNDLGKVCKADSVCVAQHKRVEAYDNVYHLVSVVKGILQKDYDSVDLIKAAFPGGSITGCPKVRSMEIIDELEPDARHIYTGSIGYISFHDTMDLSIAIRTCALFNNSIRFSVGGGIVFDSQPEDEFDETLHKGKTLMQVFKGKKPESHPVKTQFVWLNGKLMPVDHANVKVTDMGFLYGYGFFETIRADKGKPKFLKQHISRFYHTWRKIFNNKPVNISWEHIIDQVLTRNHLADQTAAIKILVSKQGDDHNYTLLVTARPYVHRLKQTHKPGLALAVYPQPRQTPLADYKTLNYLYYLMAGHWAKEHGADEAVILNPDNTLSETNTANILAIKHRTVSIPESMNVLPGIMQKAVINILVNEKFQVNTRPMPAQELFSADHVILTNSLMGAVPALSIDGKNLNTCSNLCQKINQRLFS
jgi:para-aminobenzoate synthetase component I